MAAGLGANHQTGWTGVMARAMHLFATTTADQVLWLGKRAANVETKKGRTKKTVRGGKASEFAVSPKTKNQSDL